MCPAWRYTMAALRERIPSPVTLRRVPGPCTGAISKGAEAKSHLKSHLERPKITNQIHEA